MTQHARVVLEDCRGALADLKDGVQGSEWRRGYASAVALLRAVGHVLKNVDAKASAEARNAIDAELRALKEHKAEYPIFWQFIEGERNNILKEYRFAAGQDVTVSLGGDPTTYAYPMKQGCFVGRDQREVIDEAIMFWEAHLKRVDARVHELERHSPHPLQSARR